MIEVGAFGAGRREAHAETIFAADHSIEELLPLHVLVVTDRQDREVSDHQAGQLVSIRETEILPKMIGAGRTAGNQEGQQRIEG